MNRNYNLSNRIMACFLLVGLFLQSCGGRFNSPISSVEEATDDTSTPTKKMEITKQEINGGLTAAVSAVPLLCSRSGALRRIKTSSLHLATHLRSCWAPKIDHSINQFKYTPACFHTNKQSLISSKYSPKSFVHSCKFPRVASVRTISQGSGEEEEKKSVKVK